MKGTERSNVSDMLLLEMKNSSKDRIYEIISVVLNTVSLRFRFSFLLAGGHIHATSGTPSPRRAGVVFLRGDGHSDGVHIDWPPPTSGKDQRPCAAEPGYKG